MMETNKPANVEGEYTANVETPSAGNIEAGQELNPETLMTSDPQAVSEKPADSPQAEGAPEKYEFQAPDGHAFDKVVLNSYTEIAKELGLPQASAQTMLDKLGPVLQSRQADYVSYARAGWVNSSKSDAEFGGDNLLENLAVAKKALDTFGTPELRSILNESGLGDNPEIIRAFFRAGKTLSEDKHVGGKAAPAKTSNDVRFMYPNSGYTK